MSARAMLVFMVLSSSLAHRAAGQDAVIYYDHGPGDSATVPRVSYLLPGDRATKGSPAQRHAGLPPALHIRQGSNVCVVVEHANPLLYTYTVSSRPVQTDASSDLKALLSTVTTIINAVEKSSSLPGYFAIPRAADLDRSRYTTSISRLIDIGSALDDAEQESDALAILASTAQRADSLRAIAGSENDTATKLFNDHRKDTVWVLLREVQTIAFNRVVTTSREIGAAAAASDPTFCKPLESSRLRTTLSVARKSRLPGGVRAFRPSQDSTISVISDPVSTRVFEIVPAAVVAFGMPDRRRFRIANGVVRGQKDTRPVFNPGLLALARAAGPLWGAVGVARGASIAPDLFVGLALRAGESVVGTNMIVGAGLSLSKVVVGLSEGREGAALPSDVTDVQKIGAREYRAGIGVILTVSGLSLAKKEKK